MILQDKLHEAQVAHRPFSVRCSAWCHGVGR
jgi:hypothetical protein